MADEPIFDVTIAFKGGAVVTTAVTKITYSKGLGGKDLTLTCAVGYDLLTVDVSEIVAITSKERTNG